MGLTSFIPEARPRVAVSADGTLAAVAEPTRVVVLALPSCAELAELVIDPESGAADFAWLGGRLAVLARYAAHSTVHLVDPRGPSGPRTVAEIRLEAPMKLYAAVGSHALAVGAIGAAVLAASENHLTPYQFPARTVPAAAGAAGSQFVVALSGAIEEWDPHSRMPKRRVKLARPGTITAVGGSDRVVWMTTQADPTRLDVFTFVNRGQPKSHELPEPIAHVASHPKSDMVVCVGADSGALYAVDLDGKLGTRVIAAEGIDRAESAAVIVGRMHAVLVAQTKRPLAIAVLDARDDAAAGQAAPADAADDGGAERPRSTLYDEAEAAAAAAAAAPPPASSPSISPSLLASLAAPPGASDPFVLVTAPAAPAAPAAPTAPTFAQVAKLAPPPAAPPAAPPPASATAYVDAALAKAGKPSLHRISKLQPPAKPAGAAPAQARATTSAPLPANASQSLTARFAAWRERTRAVIQPQNDAGAPLGWLEARPSWRDDLYTWARAVTTGAADRDAPAAPLVELVIARFELPPALEPALALLYGLHLAGDPGGAPADVARVLGRRWDDALGRGALAIAGVCVYRDSRVRLAPAILRVLDELPPQAGALIGTVGASSLLGPCVVVSSEPLGAVADACLPLAGGAILAARDGVPAAAVLLEARAYGAIALVRAEPALALVAPAIVVAPDDATADALGLPRLA